MKIILDGKEIEVDDAVLTKAIEEKTESIDVKIEGLTIRTTEEEESFGRNKIDEGLKQGAEVGRKDVLKAIGVEPNGAHKDTTKLAAALDTWKTDAVNTALTDANIEPNKKVEELNEQVITLKGTIDTVTGERDQAINTHTSYKQDITRNNVLIKNMPKNIKHSSDDMLLIMNSKLKTGYNDNNVLVGYDQSGAVMKNPSTGDPLPIDAVVKGFFDSNTEYINENDGGAGGGDSGGGSGKQTMTQFAEEMNKNGVEMNSQPYIDQMNERIKNGSLEV